MKDIDFIRKNLSEEDLLNQLAEEAAELAQAALKLNRAIKGSNPTPVSVDEARNRLLEEIADVDLCQWALSLFNAKNSKIINDTINRKMKRWAERLKGDKP